MNSNDYFKANDDGIGTDPTMVEIIESLDVLPQENKAEEKGKKGNKKQKKNPKKVSTTKNPDKKKGDLAKKILFTIVIILLMAGVSYGVYFYLSLGRRASGVTKFKLEDKLVYVGDLLPTSVIEYGDFSTVDISECSLDIAAVDSNVAGEYSYSVTCGKTKDTAKVIVAERIVFSVEAIPVYKVIGDEVTADEFFSTEADGYSFAFVDEPAVKSYLESGDGLYSIEITVTNDKGNETVINSLLYILSEKAKIHLTCNGAKESLNGHSYNIIDVITFNQERNYMGASLRTYSYIYESETEYEEAKLSIANGKITINNIEGYALIDNINHKIKIVNKLSENTLTEEYGSDFPETYSDINNYYRNTKKYSCSI